MKPTLISGMTLALLLAACGGGGGGDTQPTVTSISLSSSTPRYSDSVTLTLLGTDLDQNLGFSGSGCKNYTRLTTAPTVSSATVAYYSCTVSGVGAQSLTVSAQGTPGNALATVGMDVPVPQVTLLVTNGAAVSGQLVITLAPDLTPITADNFLAYVKSGFYNGTIFHRNGRTGTGGPFVLQGGGYTGPVAGNTGLPAPKPTNAAIALEQGLSNLRYTVAMARTSALNSATSEFFINTADNAFLDTSGGGYAAFGTVTTGTALVDAMSTAPCTAGFFGVGNPDCLPEPNLTIASAQQTR